jgi:hypothetical protein
VENPEAVPPVRSLDSTGVFNGDFLSIEHAADLSRLTLAASGPVASNDREYDKCPRISLSLDPHMALGPFLRRERITSVRRGSARHDRLGALVLVVAIAAGCVVAWDRLGSERASIAGAAASALAALAVVASVGGRTRARAVAAAAGLTVAWLVLPFLVVALEAGVWPSGAQWIAPTALWWLDSSPIGAAAYLAGLVPRPGSLVERVLRMIALQSVQRSLTRDAPRSSTEPIREHPSPLVPNPGDLETSAATTPQSYQAAIGDPRLRNAQLWETFESGKAPPIASSRAAPDGKER